MDDLGRLEAAEMRMLRMMCGITLKDKIRNKKIRMLTGVETLEEYLRSQRLRWFGHVQRMSGEKAPVKAGEISVDGKKVGRPKKRWREVVTEDMKRRGLEIEDAMERVKWRRGCRYRSTLASEECVPGSSSESNGR